MSDASSRIGVLFVCHANICRSPLAEAVFVHLARTRGVGGRFDVDSAGTWGIDGARPHERSIEVARQHGVDLRPFDRVARGLEPRDLERFDHLLVMDRRNLADLERLRRISAFGRVEQNEARIRLLQHVVDPSRTGAAADVDDPVSGGPADFQRAYETIERGCTALLDELLASAGSPI